MKPIIFNTEAVRAIQDGRKTVTRRILKPHNAVKANKLDYFQGNGLWYDDTFNEFDKDTHIKDYSVSSCWIVTKSYIQKYVPYKPSDILYVRETWAELETVYGDLYYAYKADDDTLHHSIGENFAHWRPSIHMPKEAARIFLRVTDVRVERLQDITEEQARAEGIRGYWAEPHNDEPPFVAPGAGSDLFHTRKEAFGKLWNSTVQKSDLAKYGWNANPWVTVNEFERINKEEAYGKENRA